MLSKSFSAHTSQFDAQVFREIAHSSIIIHASHSDGERLITSDVSHCYVIVTRSERRDLHVRRVGDVEFDAAVV